MLGPGMTDGVTYLDLGDVCLGLEGVQVHELLSHDADTVPLLDAALLAGQQLQKQSNDAIMLVILNATVLQVVQIIRTSDMLYAS